MDKDILLFATILSWIGCILTSMRLIPQVYKVIKTKETKAISLPSLITTMVATAVWIQYAILKNELAIIVTNALIMFFALSIASCKFYNILHKNEN